MIAAPAPRRPARAHGARAGTPPTGATSRAVAALVTALVAVLALAGCDLRFESAPPGAPTPGPAEVVRERTVADALALAAAARSAQATADAASAAVLGDVVTFSAAHARQLGGLYDPGLATPTPSTPAPPVVATPADVLRALRADAAVALADAAAATDGATARLLAAVGVSRSELATRLATTLHEPAAPPTAAPTPAPNTSPTASSAPTAAPSASPSPAPSGTTAAATAALAPLVLAHDQAGFGLEVIAAKLSGAARQEAVAAASAHRHAAESWAQRAGIAGTATDPRRAVYALPTFDAAGAPALAATLEAGVAQAASAALVGAPLDTRSSLVDELAAAQAAAAAWGAAPTAFPGIPGLD